MMAQVAEHRAQGQGEREWERVGGGEKEIENRETPWLTP